MSKPHGPRPADLLALAEPLGPDHIEHPALRAAERVGIQPIDRVSVSSRLEVWRAVDARDRDLILRVPRLGPTYAADVGRALSRQADILALVDHAGVERLIDAGGDDEHAYLATHFHAGVPASLWANESRPDAEMVSRVLRQVLVALAHLHTRGVAHGDLKPDNVIVDCDGRAVLIDFETAHWAEDAPPTRTNPVLAGSTPEYAPPWSRPDNLASPAADVYAAARTVEAMFDGRPPREWARVVCRACDVAGPENVPTADELLAELGLSRAPTERRVHRTVAAAVFAGVGLLVLAGAWPQTVDGRDDGGGAERHAPVAPVEAADPDELLRAGYAAAEDGDPGAAVRLWTSIVPEDRDWSWHITLRAFSKPPLLTEGAEPAALPGRDVLPVELQNRLTAWMPLASRPGYVLAAANEIDGGFRYFLLDPFGQRVPGVDWVLPDLDPTAADHWEDGPLLIRGISLRTYQPEFRLIDPRTGETLHAKASPAGITAVCFTPVGAAAVGERVHLYEGDLTEIGSFPFLHRLWPADRLYVRDDRALAVSRDGRAFVWRMFE